MKNTLDKSRHVISFEYKKIASKLFTHVLSKVEEVLLTCI